MEEIRHGQGRDQHLGLRRVRRQRHAGRQGWLRVHARQRAFEEESGQRVRRVPPTRAVVEQTLHAAGPALGKVGRHRAWSVLRGVPQDFENRRDEAQLPGALARRRRSGEAGRSALQAGDVRGLGRRDLRHRQHHEGRLPAAAQRRGVRGLPPGQKRPRRRRRFRRSQRCGQRADLPRVARLTLRGSGEPEARHLRRLPHEADRSEPGLLHAVPAAEAAHGRRALPRLSGHDSGVPRERGHADPEGDQVRHQHRRRGHARKCQGRTSCPDRCDDPQHDPAGRSLPSARRQEARAHGHRGRA